MDAQRMADRYFIDELITADHITLGGSEAHHLIHVMRASPGQQVTLFDGSGDEFPAVVERVGRSDVQLVVLSRKHVDRELPFVLTLAVALPKGDRQKWFVEKAVELGVTQIVPLRTNRSVAEPGEQVLTRLRRVVIEASKQCGRNRLTEIGEPQVWPGFVGNTTDRPCRLLAHPGIPASASSLCWHRDEVIAAVGPEGGFTEEEVSLAVDAGWRTIDLGPRILRVETAALALAAIIGSVGATSPRS